MLQSEPEATLAVQSAAGTQAESAGGSVPIDVFTPLESGGTDLPPVSEVGFTSECDGDERSCRF